MHGADRVEINGGVGNFNLFESRYHANCHVAVIFIVLWDFLKG